LRVNQVVEVRESRELLEHLPDFAEEFKPSQISKNQRKTNSENQRRQKIFEKKSDNRQHILHTSCARRILKILNVNVYKNKTYM
jgi:hypothetical protein